MNTKLRNKANCLIKNDCRNFNNERMRNANDENEIWRIASEITKPKNESEWKMKDNNDIIIDEQVIADKFNNHFVEKIKKLKSKIDQDFVSDPLEKLKNKLKNNSLKFDLKLVTEKSLKAAFKKIKKRKVLGVMV